MNLMAYSFVGCCCLFVEENKTAQNDMKLDAIFIKKFGNAPMKIKI